MDAAKDLEKVLEPEARKAPANTRRAKRSGKTRTQIATGDYIGQADNHSTVTVNVRN